MSKLINIAILLFCCAFVAANVLPSESIKATEGCKEPTCEIAEERNKFWPSPDANVYWQCRLNFTSGVWKAEKFECYKGLFFGFKQQRCVWPEEWKDACGQVEETTSEKTLELFASPSCEEPTCQTVDERNVLWPHFYAYSYWQCRLNFTSMEWKAEKFDCHKGLFFGIYQQRCVWPEQWEASCHHELTSEKAPELFESALCPPPTCQTVAERNLIWPSTEPNLYWQCRLNFTSMEWKAEKFECYKGLYFDYEQQRCVWPEEWTDVCSQVEETTTVKAPEYFAIPSCNEPTCATVDEKNVFWPMEEPNFFWQCRLNFTSMEWKAEKIACYQGLYFGFDQQRCVWPKDWKGYCGGEQSTTNAGNFETNCTEPNCNELEQRNIFWPKVEPNLFWECRLNFTSMEWKAEEFECYPGLYFGFKQQRCVWPSEWTDQCEDQETTEVIPSETTTTEQTETEKPTTTTQSSTTEAATTQSSSTEAATTQSSSTEKPTTTTQSSSTEAVTTQSSSTEKPTTTTQSSTTEAATTQSSSTEKPTTTTQSSTTEKPTETTTVALSTTTEELSTTTEATTTEIGDPETPLPITCGEPACAIVKDPIFAWPSRKNDEFWICEHLQETGVWLPRIKKCSEGLLFSFKYQDCVNPKLWTDACPDPSVTFPPFTTVTIPTEEPITKPPVVLCGKPRCTTPGERSIIWPSNMKDSYYECHWFDNLYQFIPVLISCAKPSLFDYEKQACVNATKWDDYCEFMKFPKLPIVCGEAHCETEAEKAFKWPGVAAQYYIVCDEENGKVGKECPEGLLFDVFEQNCVIRDEWRDICPIYPAP